MLKYTKKILNVFALLFLLLVQVKNVIIALVSEGLDHAFRA